MPRVKVTGLVYSVMIVEVAEAFQDIGEEQAHARSAHSYCQGAGSTVGRDESEGELPTLPRAIQKSL